MAVTRLNAGKRVNSPRYPAFFIFQKNFLRRKELFFIYGRINKQEDNFNYVKSLYN